MAINNKLLINCINDCYCSFLNYYNIVFLNSQSIIDFWKDSETNVNEFEKFKKNEKKCNILYIENLKEIEWYISQQTPVANNLRFFLTVLMSLKDIERWGDYIFTISKIIHKNKKILKNVLGEFLIWNLLNSKISEIWEIFLTEKGKINTQNFLKIKKIKHEFQTEFKKYFHKINTYLINNFDTTQQYKRKTLFSNIYLILVKIDRIFDHILNIVENFYIIEHPNPKKEILF